MKFTINQDIFSDLLQQHLPVIPVRSAMPILNSLKWDIISGKLRIYSTDLEISLLTEIEVESDGNGAVAVPARKLSEIIRELPNEPITVNIEESFRVIIHSTTGQYQIPGSDPEDFPPISESGMEEKVVMTGEKFKRLINQTAFSVSRDDMRPSLCGAFFQVLEEDIRMVATDGHRLSKIVDLTYDGSGKPFEVIVPVKALQLSVKSIDDEDKVRISSVGSLFMIYVNNSFLFSRLIEGRYPPYDTVIPKTNEYILIANTENLTSAVRRVAIFSNSLTKQVRFSLKAEKMAINAEDIETGGEAEEELDVDYQGEEMDIGYNAQYFLDALRKIDTEEVKISIGTKDSASLVQPTEQQEGEEFVMLLMPVRLH